MTKVFISYSRKDKGFAEKLNSALEAIHLESWIDWDDIPPTADWWDQIQKGIESADAVLFLLSGDSVSSKVCGQEIEHALKNAKRIIPLVVRDVSPEDVHPALARLNWIFFREQDDFNHALQKLQAGIQTDLTWVEAHRRLQVRALEWEKRKEASLLLRGKDLHEAEAMLAASAQKDPQPTDLQRQFLLASRTRETRTRNVVIAISMVAMIALAIASVVAVNQSRYATHQASTAVAESNLRSTAESNAVANEREAVRQAQIAATNEAEASKQAQIAFARQLAAQAEAVNAQGYEKQTTAVLLAIQSMKIFPTGESARFLQNHTLALPAASMAHQAPVEAVAFSADGHFIISGGEDGTVRIWDVASRQATASFSHDGKVTFVAFSPDGLMAVTGSDDKTVRTWDARTGKEIARVTHTKPVHLVSVSPDGKYVLSSDGCEQGDPEGFFCELGSVRIWEAATGKEITRFTHKGYLASAAFSPDGKYVVSGGGDGAVRVWETTTGRETAALPHGLWVSAVAFSPQGDRIASAGCERSPAGSCTQGSIRVWLSQWSNDFADTVEEAVISQQFDPSSIAFSPDGWKLVSIDGQGSAHVWGADSGQEVFSLSAGDGITGIIFSKDGRSLASYGAETGRVWDTASGREMVCMLHGYDKGITSIAFSPDGKYVVSGNRDGTVFLWHTDRSQFLFHLNGIKALALGSQDDQLIVAASGASTIALWNVTTGQDLALLPSGSQIDTVVFNPDLKYVALSDFQNVVRIWEVPGGREILRSAQEKSVYALAFSPDGQYVASGGVDGIAHVWEAATGKEIARVSHPDRVDDVIFSQDGKLIASSGCDEHKDGSCLRDTVRVWMAATGEEIVRLPHEGYVSSMAFSPDAKYVVTGGCDEVSNSRCSAAADSAHLWEIHSGQEVVRIAHAGRIQAVAFSPDGRYVVSAGEDNTARVWEVASGKEVARMTHDRSVTTVAFSPDGNYVVSGAADSTARVWEANTGREIARMTHETPVFTVLFSADGKYVASASEDGTIIVWVWRPADLMSAACQRLSRNLTRAEWQLYIGSVLPYQAVCPGLPVEPEITPTPSVTP